MSFYVKFWEKEVLEKTILVLEKSLIFSQKFCVNHVTYLVLLALTNSPGVGGGGGGTAIYGLYRYVPL